MAKAGNLITRMSSAVVMAGALALAGIAWAGVGVTGTGRFFGEITDFASIYVNGVEFSTAGATILVNGSPATQADLRKGMAVRVEGTINPDGVTGTATLVEFLGDIEGAIDAAPVVSGKSGSLTIYGLLVRTDAQTQFAGVASLAALQAGDIVEVSGYFNANDGSFTATRIEKQSVFRKVEMRGYISNVTPSSFSMGNLTVNYSASDLRDIPPPGTLANGMFVDLNSLTAPVNGVITARRVNGQESVLLEATLPPGAAGIVNGIAANVTATSMKMGNLPVAISAATVFDGAPVSALQNGAKAIAAGTVTSGVMNAAAVTIVPQLVSVTSVKNHGAAGAMALPVDPNADINGALTVEPRAIGSGHTLMFTFNGPVTSLGYTGTVPVPAVISKDAAGLADVGTVDSVVLNGNTVTVTLSGNIDGKRARMTLNNINVLGVDVPVAIGFLVGDVNSDGKVDAADASAVKARAGQTTTAANFVHDLNLSGTINSTDIVAAKARSGASRAP
jgi:hypothetical protein